MTNVLLAGFTSHWHRRKSSMRTTGEEPTSATRQLWAYTGLAIETHDSAENQYVNGQLQRSKKQSSIRGLNPNHNPDLKNLFKSASAVAAVKAGPFQKFYAALIGKGIKPEMARLTLARKIAAITLIVWKRGVSFDARYLNPQTA